MLNTRRIIKTREIGQNLFSENPRNSSLSLSKDPSVISWYSSDSHVLLRVELSVPVPEDGIQAFISEKLSN
jgi:hypothetical protein